MPRCSLRASHMLRSLNRSPAGLDWFRLGANIDECVEYRICKHILKWHFDILWRTWLICILTLRKKAFIAPSVSDIEESDMRIIVSGPHLMIAADIKCQTSFVFSGIKDRFHFPAWGRLQHFQFCCRYCLSVNFPATSPLLTLSGEIKCVSAKEIWLVLIKSKSEHRNQDGRSSELFLRCWRVDVQGQKDSSKRDSLTRLSWSCSIITSDGRPSQRPDANLSSSACSEQQQLHCELSGFWALRIIWAGSEGEGWGNIFTSKVRASPSSSALSLQRTARFLKLKQGVRGQIDLQALFLIPAHPQPFFQTTQKKTHLQTSSQKL